MLESQLLIKYCCVESGILGINLGKNKETTNDWVDYVEGIRKFEILADYIVINVSSPNTPNLRGLQAREKLEELIDHVSVRRLCYHRDFRAPVYSSCSVLKLEDLSLSE